MVAFGDLTRVKARNDRFELGIARQGYASAVLSGGISVTWNTDGTGVATPTDSQNIRGFLAVGGDFRLNGIDITFVRRANTGTDGFNFDGVPADPSSLATTFTQIGKWVDGVTRRMRLTDAAPTQRFPTTQLSDFDAHEPATDALWQARTGDSQTVSAAQASILAAIKAQPGSFILQTIGGKEIFDEVLQDLNATQFAALTTLEVGDDLILEHSDGDNVRLRITDVVVEAHDAVTVKSDVTEKHVDITEVTGAHVTAVHVLFREDGTDGFLRRSSDSNRRYTVVGHITQDDLPDPKLTTEGHFRSLRGRPNQHFLNGNGRRQWDYPDTANLTETVVLWIGDWGWAFVIDDATNDDLDGRAKLVTTAQTTFLDPPQFDPPSVDHTLQNANALNFTIPTTYEDIIGTVGALQVGGSSGLVGTATITGGVLTYDPPDDAQDGFMLVHAWDSTERRLTYRINIHPA